MSTNKLERYLRLGDLMFNEPFYRSFVNVKYAARFIQDPRTDLKTIDIFLNLLKQAQNTPPTPGRQDNLNVTPQVNPSGNQGTQSRDTRQPTTPSGGSPQTQSPVTTPLTQTTPGQTPPQPEAPKSPLVLERKLVQEQSLLQLLVKDLHHQDKHLPDKQQVLRGQQEVLLREQQGSPLLVGLKRADRQRLE